VKGRELALWTSLALQCVIIVWLVLEPRCTEVHALDLRQRVGDTEYVCKLSATGLVTEKWVGDELVASLSVHPGSARLDDVELSSANFKHGIRRFFVMEDGQLTIGSMPAGDADLGSNHRVLVLKPESIVMKSGLDIILQLPK